MVYQAIIKPVKAKLMNLSFKKKYLIVDTNIDIKENSKEAKYVIYISKSAIYDVAL